LDLGAPLLPPPCPSSSLRSDSMGSWAWVAPGVNGRQRRRRPQRAAAIKIGQWMRRRRPWNVEIQTVYNCSPCWHYAANNLKDLRWQFILSLTNCLQLCISESAAVANLGF
jgi:hypothetical protein